MIGGAKGIGLGIDLGLVNQYNRTGSQSYIEPEVLDSLVGVWSAYGMTNDSPNRSTIKNKLSNKGGDFVISNAAYDKMSSYGGYEFAKFDNTLDWYNTEGNDSVEVVSRNGHSITLKRLTGPNFWYFQNSTFRGLISNVIPFKVNSNKNITVIWDVHGLSISEGKDKSVRVQELVLNPNEDNYTNLKTLNEEELAQIDISTNSLYYLLWFDLSTLAVDEEVTIEMLPLFEGAFVTDGIDDLITSTKTVQEMLGGSNEITVVSMAHFIKGESNAPEMCRINQIRRDTRCIRNTISKIGKSGIFGYTYKNGVTTINNILGDKNDCTTEGNLDGIVAPFSVEGYYYNNNSNPLELCSIAWYWTIIANKVLTTDQINQVIAYFNLDKTLKPDMLCNITKQGITNDNHADFNDKLIDYSGNGRDIQMNNLAWKGGSGIAAKPFETIKDYTIVSDEARQKLTIYNEFSYKIKSNTPSYYWTVQSIIKDNTSYQVTIITDKDCYWINGTNFINSEGNKEGIRKKYPVLANTPTQVIICGLDQFEYPEGIEPTSAVSYVNLEYAGEITVTFIPSYKGGILLDGINDFGQFVGDLGLKDYTFIADRAYDRIVLEQAPFIASTQTNGQAPFLMEYLNEDTYVYPHSFGTTTKTTNLNIQRQISYQSTYVYNGNSISKGTSVDTGDGLTIGNSGSTGLQYSPLCLWSLMLFPYSMSEFLIERQLKKHKLGTLYPNMVEFRPIIPEDENITRIDYFVVNSGKWTVIKPGDYVDVGARFVLNVYTKFPYKVEKASSLAFTGMSVGASTRLNVFDVKGYIKDKTPQKIKLTLAVNEDIVQWNPTITSNLLDSFTVSSWYLNDWDNTLTEGTWIKKTDKVFFKATFKTELYGLETATFGGTECVVSKADNWSDSINIWDIRMLGTIGDLSQVFNLDVYELIRFEDIVQPYPLFFEFTDENGNLISWGGKAKVGSTITRIGSAADSNLLPNIYNIFGLLLNDNQVTSSKVIVEKTMVFKAKSAYIFDDNEPKCILSPRLLRIPNSSYKILGYIPDISGHGNHGVIHNSAYAEGSGVNEDGSYQFDGVDDFVTIPTVTGGKQVLMKVNWDSSNSALLYDQRGYNNELAIYNGSADSDGNPMPAYSGRNNGQTYIDGILNSNIKASELRAITHNITITNELSAGVNKFSPVIGSNRVHNAYFTNMALYDFMLFDEISTDDKIKELNKYVGIEGNVWGILTKLSNSTLISNETLIKNE